MDPVICLGELIASLEGKNENELVVRIQCDHDHTYELSDVSTAQDGSLVIELSRIE